MTARDSSPLLQMRYDLLDRLTRVVDRNGYATIYEYDANGNRTKVTYANGYTTTYLLSNKKS